VEEEDDRLGDCWEARGYTWLFFVILGVLHLSFKDMLEIIQTNNSNMAALKHANLTCVIPVCMMAECLLHGQVSL
jgi:hypothetical protein